MFSKCVVLIQPRWLLRILSAAMAAGLLITLAACGTGTTTASGTLPTTATTATTAPESTNAAAVRKISPPDAKAKLAENPQILLLDVRTAEEYETGHIEGSKLLPYDEIESRAGELPADKQNPIIVYCRTGRRSAIAADTLLRLGYTTVYDLGGIQDWPYPTVVS
jgi:phage shock protein E